MELAQPFKWVFTSAFKTQQALAFTFDLKCCLGTSFEIDIATTFGHPSCCRHLFVIGSFHDRLYQCSHLDLHRASCRGSCRPNIIADDSGINFGGAVTERGYRCHHQLHFQAAGIGCTTGYFGCKEVSEFETIVGKAFIDDIIGSFTDSGGNCWELHRFRNIARCYVVLQV